MALDKEQAQGIIDDFVFSNDTELQKISGENKALFNATINALDFLSKKFGTGQEISKDRVLQMSELPFNIGDKFYIGTRGSDSVYTIENILIDKGIVPISVLTKDNQVHSYEYPIDQVKKAFDDGTWIKIPKKEEDYGVTLKVGDKFLRPSTGMIYVISKIKEGAKPDEEKSIDVANAKNGFPENSFSRNDIMEFLFEEVWTRVEEEKPIRKFDVGDRFNVNKTILNFTIDHITDSDVGVIYDDGLTAIVKIDQFADGIISGYYKPIGKKNDSKIGDLIVDTHRDKIYEIEEIDISTQMIKFVTESGSAARWTPFSIYESNLKSGSFKKLSFKVGDTFETPTQETKEIVSRNGIIFDVTTNNSFSPKPVLYNVIQDRIDSGDWTKLVFSEPKAMTTPDLSQAQPNATQQMMAKATATPIMTASSSASISAKLPKKTLSKDQKAIKALQIDIDTLELIADFDEDAKQELEKKQAEIKALKSKIS
jgi:hypothetical protein